MNKSQILNYILAAVMLVLIVKLAYKEKPENTIIINSVQTDSVPQQKTISINTTHQARVWLTVAESKRLIAKGLKKYPPVQEKLKNGYVLITKGTTNTYVAEEFLNDTLSAGEYVLGHILPANGNIELDQSQERKEVIFRNGILQNASYQEILKEIFTAANILDEKGEVNRPVLHIIIRGIKDSHGVDVEISTRNGRSCSGKLAHMAGEILKTAIEGNRSQWKTCVIGINSMFHGGSKCMEMNRNGGERFCGFGQNYQALEIRISMGTRKTYLDEIIDGLCELTQYCQKR